ncbi:hypothetical protein ACFOWM_05095 [Ferruginibacter yonginensis]|uniref:Uncharacterized protein n=1 Tax=Ferruginibacter yonginensis TaxID=1310416 RepID=A0ABV8QRH4_9BACT
MFATLSKLKYLLVGFTLFGKICVAQPMVKQTAACENSMILKQVDSLKAEFQKQGFIVVKEASMPMESEYEIPVVVPLREGTWYRVIFIGDITSRLYEVRMYDWNERQVVYQKKMWGDVDGNIINYDYIPKFTEYHMIKPVQVNKKNKNVCGYIMMFKKVIK